MRRDASRLVRFGFRDLRNGSISGREILRVSLKRGPLKDGYVVFLESVSERTGQGAI